MFSVEILAIDHLARLATIDGIKTPAISIVNNNKLRIFETFAKMSEGNFVEVDPNEITYLPHIIPQYKENVVKESVDKYLEKLDSAQIIALSYYRAPSVYDSLKEKKLKMVIVRDVPKKASLRGLIEFLLYLREIIGWETIIQISSYIDWKFIPYLVYMGVDVIDVGPYELKILRSGVNQMVGYGTSFLLGFVPREEKEKEELVKINRAILDDLFTKIRKAISKGKIRELIEIYSHIDQETDAILAFLDNQYFHYFEQRVSVRKPPTNIFVGAESFNRPVVKWYLNRFRERYIPPKIPHIIVLFPCAARKPYSYSKSHKLFKEALNQGAGGLLYMIHEVMLTSPIGVVPRELEFSYPNAHYDTTTTGNWSISEIHHTASMLEIYLKKKFELNERTEILVHLEGGYKEAAVLALENLGLEYKVTTENKHPTDLEALNALSRTLSNLLEKTTFMDSELRRKRNIEDAQSILSYQFGSEIATKFVNSGKVEGSLFSQKGFTIREVAVFDRGTGFFIPLKKGAEILLEEKRFYGIVDLDKLSTKNLKGSDIAKIDQKLQPGEFIVIGNRDMEPLGVGVTLFSGKDIVRASESRVIEVVKQFK